MDEFNRNTEQEASEQTTPYQTPVRGAEDSRAADITRPAEHMNRPEAAALTAAAITGIHRTVLLMTAMAAAAHRLPAEPPMSSGAEERNPTNRRSQRNHSISHGSR